MVSTFHGLELGKRGLMVGQASIATTGHNMANANTKGYSRQQVNATTSPSLDIWTSGQINPGQLGSGVSIDSITRVRDHFLDRQYRDQSATIGEWSVKQETLDRLETIINEPSDTGLQSAMDQLWGAFQDLANEPDSLSAKVVIKERAQEFVETAQAINRSMTYLNDSLTDQIIGKVSEANGYLTQIEQLNESIKRSGTNANDLLDKRDVLVEELSKIMAIDVAEQPNGTYNISLKSDPTNTPLTQIDIPTAEETGELFGGELSGLIQSKEIVSAYQENFNTVVTDFVAASEMSGTDENPGVNLFAGEDINSLTVNPALKENIELIAPFSSFEENNYETVKSDFRSIVSKLGAESQAAMNYNANYGAALQATENRRQSMTGISLDEEMVNLVKYQHSYNAAARMISTVDQMLDTIINRMAAR